MTFAELIESAGGPSEVVKAAPGVSRSHLANIVARRKRLTPDVVAAIRPCFPKVATRWWLERLLEPLPEPAPEPSDFSEGSTDAA